MDASLNYDDVKAEDWYGEAVRWADSVGVSSYGSCSLQWIGRDALKLELFFEKFAKCLWIFCPYW